MDQDVVDLAAGLPPAAIGDEPSLTLVASTSDELFRRQTAGTPLALTGTLVINPLYALSVAPDRSVLRLQFPTPEYAEEFADCRRYLPDEVTIDADLTRTLVPELFGDDYADLRRRRVLIDAPPRYC